MKKIIIHTGFHPEVKREYKGEHIYTVKNIRGLTPSTNEPVSSFSFVSGTGASGNAFYQISNDVWIKHMGDEKYVTDWTSEERWGRVEEVEYSDARVQIAAKTLGFMVLRVDRSKGML